LFWRLAWKKRLRPGNPDFMIVISNDAENARALRQLVVTRSASEIPAELESAQELYRLIRDRLGT